jgi:hypothetical protein
MYRVWEIGEVGACRELMRMPERKGLLGISRHTDGRIILKWIFSK